eukprot:CAMPEP_0116096854 /NCGR_PEP_ID=MMETSP0327-20121206/10401_1 /TAXON_ID=44447 /ORGANISM="Pseudo-nitzschia delicatissima, Strain B596" /LENGTH=319 /DNA_ID=CAMNT_0003588581 /DNA_START=122 /DNA_END=1081 /DNA_ORIENTATION=+
MAGGPIFLSMLAAALFWATNAVQITQYIMQSARWKEFDKEQYYSLIPANIADEWDAKYRQRALEYSSGFLKGAFWIVFSLPVIEMAWVLSRRGTRSLGCNVAIAVFCLAGSWSKWFSTILWTGIYISFIQLTNNFNLETWLTPELAEKFGLDEDGIGWSAVEVNYLNYRGMTLIVDAADWLCLSIIFLLIFASVREWRKEDYTTFGGKWNSMGLFIGLLSGVQFILEIVGAAGIKFSYVLFILYALLLRLILIPLWIIIMGFQLSKASSKEFDGIDTRQLELSEVPASNFTIDDDDDDDVPVGPLSPPAAAFASPAITE